MTPHLLESLRLWLPELILAVGAMAVMLCGACLKRPRPALLAAWAAMALAAVALLAAPAAPAAPFFGLISLDPLSRVFRWLAWSTIALTSLLVACSDEVEPRWTGELLGLLLAVGVGLMAIAESVHLLMAVLSIELVSLSSYCLVAMARTARASEAALKYLLFGALSSGIMLFGMSWLFGLTGQMAFPAIRASLVGVGPPLTQACVLAVGLVLVGLAFKISMVPFHMWTPDVYEGAPLPVTAMLSVGPKAAGLALLLRLAWALGPVWVAAAPVLIALTIVTMTLGNVLAIAQTNVKRLLAYSTIGQVGYLLIGFVINTPQGYGALVLYLIAYLFMNLGLFAGVVAVHRATRSESLEAFRGLAHRAPALAAACAIFLLSLAGMPPLLGFFGKFLLFGSAIESHRVALAVVGAINSALALYYYVNVIRLMYLLAPAPGAASLRPSWPARLAVGACAAATVGWGLCPGGLLVWIGRLIAENPL